MPQLTVDGVGLFEVPHGSRLVLATDEAGIDQLHACGGGNARCTTCRVVHRRRAGTDRAERPARRPRPDAVPRPAAELQLTCDRDMTVKAISRLAARPRRRRQAPGPTNCNRPRRGPPSIGATSRFTCCVGSSRTVNLRARRRAVPGSIQTRRENAVAARAGLLGTAADDSRIASPLACERTTGLGVLIAPCFEVWMDRATTRQSSRVLRSFHERRVHATPVRRVLHEVAVVVRRAVGPPDGTAAHRGRLRASPTRRRRGDPSSSLVRRAVATSRRPASACGRVVRDPSPIVRGLTSATAGRARWKQRPSGVSG